MPSGSLSARPSVDRLTSTESAPLLRHRDTTHSEHSTPNRLSLRRNHSYGSALYHNLYRADESVINSALTSAFTFNADSSAFFIPEAFDQVEIASSFPASAVQSQLPSPVLEQDSDEEEVLAVPSSAKPTDAPTRTRAQVFTILGALWVGSFLAALDSTIVASAIPVITASLSERSSSGLSSSWLGTAYMLSQSACQPLYGKTADIFGRKTMTAFASITFLIGSLACGFATTFEQLVVARAFAGIGGGGLATMMSIVTSDLVSLKQRGVYQGIGNVIYSLGASLGGPMGGLLSDSIGWRSVFLVQVPICAIHLVLVLWKVNIPVAGGNLLTKLKRVDFLGAGILAAGVVLLLLGLSEGGVSEPWTNPKIWGSIAAGLGLLATFLLVEIYVAKEPICAPRILLAPNPLAISLANFFNSSLQFSIIYTIPAYFAAVQQTSNALAGTHLIPFVVATSVSSLSCGLILARTGRYRPMMWFCIAIGVAAQLSIDTWDPARTWPGLYWISMFVAGFTFGGILTLTLVALMASVLREDMAAATGVSYLFRSTGSVVGIALSTTILQSTLKSELLKNVKLPDMDEFIHRVTIDLESINALPDDLQHIVRAAYQFAMSRVFLFMTMLSIFVVLAVLPIKQHHLTC